MARVLSKRGVCSRSEGARWIAEGRVEVDGRTIRDPEFPVVAGRHRIKVDGRPLQDAAPVYLALNKPRGLVTSASDEQARPTVYQCLEDAPVAWLAPVGRLDKASEGLLLFCNDPAWAAGLTQPRSGFDKTYHVQVDGLPDEAVLQSLRLGVVDLGEHLAAKSALLLRSGGRNAWLEIVLDEGRNRHIRRLLEVLGLRVLRLVRVAIGPLPLGRLEKGQWRLLSQQEVEMLTVALNPGV
ncbi:MAG: rRNA pseudouridine synthase [Pseudomonadota bacterium]|nr:rRNA pseudouridine synthase [Pseudomonadota bacterium]